MSERNDGGPAFPGMLTEDGMIASGEEVPRGMSLREWFAGQALVGLGTWTPSIDGLGLTSLDTPEGLKARAEWAVAQADAMIEALKK